MSSRPTCEAHREGVGAARAKGRITEQRFESALSRFETAGVGANLPPFAGFVAWWIRKRLGKR